MIVFQRVDFIAVIVNLGDLKQTSTDNVLFEGRDKDLEDLFRLGIDKTDVLAIS